MSNGIQVFEPLAGDLATLAPETERAETLESPELRALMEELDKHLQTFLREHNSAERLS
jgi:hypothetical protein